MDQSKRLAAFLEKYSRLSVVTCLCFGLVLRIFAFLSLKDSPYFGYLLWDERLYHTWAAKIAKGTYASSTIYEASPLPAYVIGFVYRLFTPDPTSVRILNIGFGVLTCYLVYLIGKELSGHKAGLAACLMACLYKPFIFYSIVPLKTSMSVFLFALTVYFFLASFKRTSLLYLLFLGTAAGLMFNVGPNAAVLLPIMPLLIILAMRKQDIHPRTMAAALVIYAVGLCLSLSPFVIRNYRIANRWAVGPTQSGFNLYLGNNLANPDPYYRPVPFAIPSPRVQGIQFTVEASRRLNKKLTPSEASSYWSKEVFRIAWQNPGAFLQKLWLKTLVFFNQFEAGDHYHIGFMANFVPFFKLPFPGLWLMLPIGLAGMSVTLLESRKSLALGLILFAYGATLVAFFCSARYRLPIAVGLIPFAVIGVEHLWFFIKIRNWQKIVLYTTISAGFFVVEFLPVKATDDLSAYYNTHAIVLRSSGSAEGATQYWKKSSQMEKPFSAFANLSLAGRYLGRKEIEKAVSYLNKIPEDSFAAASKYEMMGDIRIRRGQVEEATSAYLISLKINSAQLRVRKKLISIYRKIDPEKAKEASKELKNIELFYESPF